MARSLHSIIQDIFSTVDCNTRYRGYSSYHYEAGFQNKKYMEIPIDEWEMEIPVFAFPTFRNIIAETLDVNSIIVHLETRWNQSCYTSLNKILEDTLRERYEGTKLMVIHDKTSTKLYYGTYGAIFNDKFEPILMCSWVVRKYLLNNEFNFECVNPIIRISPECFVSQSDSIERLISKKFPMEALSGGKFHYFNREGRSLGYDPDGYVPKIIIEKSPFSIKNIDVPSISTTNEALLKTALDNIDDFMLCR